MRAPNPPFMIRSTFTVYLNRGRLIFKRGGFEVTVDVVKVMDLKIPPEFFMLILNGDREAHTFLKSVLRAPIVAGYAKDNLVYAFLKDRESAWRNLKSYIDEAPHGKPKLYKAYSAYLDLTDGKTCFRFMLKPRAFRVVDLPENVYCDATSGLKLEVDGRRHLEFIKERIEDFFKFMKRLNRIHEAELKILYGLAGEVEGIYKAYFMDPAEAWRRLREAEGEMKHRLRVEEAFFNFVKKKVERCRGGFLVWVDPYVCYVTDDGRVYRINEEGLEGRLYEVYRTLRRGAKPRNLVEEWESWVLTEVARRIGKVKPDLTIILAP